MNEVVGRITEKEKLKKVKIDLKDRKILALLSENSRAPSTEISKRVGLSRDSVDYRIKRLEDKGVILRFFPVIDLKRFGYFVFHVFMLLDETDKEKQKSLLDDLIKHPNTKCVFEYSDRWDIELKMVARTVREFDDIATDIISRYPDMIMEKDKLAVIKTYNSINLPYDFYPEKPKAKDIQKKPAKLDKKDIKILRYLSDDCRQSTYSIAEKIKISPDSVSYRIKKMVETGIITKFTVLINLTMLDYHWYTFAMQMKVFDKKSESKFRHFVENHPYIIRAVKTLGDWDLMLYIIADSPRNFHSTVKEIKNVFSNTIKNYQTWVGYKEHFFTGFPKVIE